MSSVVSAVEMGVVVRRKRVVAKTVPKQQRAISHRRFLNTNQ
jgi:hypothetical protein